MLLGYNTNGFAHHRLEDALDILAELGYRSVALTLDHGALDPYDAATPRQAERVRRLLTERSLRCVVETGARFLLDARHKHQPTLVSTEAADRGRRLDFLCRSIDLAAEVGAEAVSFWSGTSLGTAAPTELLTWLTDGCRRLCDRAAARGVRLAFEPEPGMLIDTMSRYGELAERVAHPAFGLTLDIGHLHCQGELPLADQIVRWCERLWNVHLEDMRQGIHEHLFFGEGEIDFREVFDALHRIDYRGGVHVELSRHSHNAVETARHALAFLQGLGNVA